MSEFSLRRELDVLRRMNDSKGRELSRYTQLYEKHINRITELEAINAELVEALKDIKDRSASLGYYSIEAVAESYLEEALAKLSVRN